MQRNNSFFVLPPINGGNQLQIEEVKDPIFQTPEPTKTKVLREENKSKENECPICMN